MVLRSCMSTEIWSGNFHAEYSVSGIQYLRSITAVTKPTWSFFHVKLFPSQLGLEPTRPEFNLIRSLGIELTREQN